MKRYSFLIIILLLTTFFSEAQTTCSGVWGIPIVNQTFGQGNATDPWYGPLDTYAPGTTTSTTFVGSAGPSGGQLSDGFSGLAKTPAASGQGNWVQTTDHTGDPFGLMFLINAPSTASTVFFEYTMNDLCPNTTLKLSVWIINANITSLSTGNPTYQYPNMTIQAVDPISNAVLATIPSGDVAADEVWHQFSLIFNNGSNTSIKLQLVNNSVGSGFGNDLALDDITVQPCVPIAHVLPKLDTLVCQNTSINFTGNVIASPYNPAEFQWQQSIDGGVTWVDQGAPSASSFYTFVTNTAPPGTYMFRYKTGPQGATANANCIGVSDTSIVTVSSPPVLPVIDYISQYCTGMAFVPFTIVSGTNLKWYDSATGGTGSTTTPMINTDMPGDYTFYVSQTTAQGCESNRLAMQIKVLQTPVPDFSTTIAAGCSSDTVHFQNQSINGTDYHWDFNDGFMDTASNPSHIYSTQNTYYVKLKVTNQYCSDSVSKPVIISHPLQALFSPSSDTLCVGNTVDFSDHSIATTVYNIDPSYYWEFGDGGISTLQNPGHTYSQAGIYNAMMVIQNGIPCMDTAYKLIYVDSLPQISFTGSDTAICTGHNILFTGNYTKNGLKDVQWNFGEAPDHIDNINPARHAYEIPGVYTVTLYGNYRVCPDVSATARITVKTLPKINLGQDTALCLDGKAVTLTDNINAANPRATWLWNTGSQTASAQIVHDGVYTATVTIDQCSASDDIIVHKNCNIDIPNSFTPNGDGVNDYFFPRQYLSNGVTGFTMTVFNRWGQKVFETKNQSGRGWDGKLNDKDQAVGVYIYSINVVMQNQRTETYTGNVTLLR